jgi:hypothetical protein
MSTLRLLAKAIGIGAVGISAYDICSETKRAGNNYVRYAGAQRAQDCFLRTSTTTSKSAFGNSVQNWIRERSLHSPIFRLYDKIVGFSKSLVDSTGRNIDKLGLGILALIGSGKGILGKIPILGIASAGILAAHGINFLIENIFGNSNNPK